MKIKTLKILILSPVLYICYEACPTYAADPDPSYTRLARKLIDFEQEIERRQRNGEEVSDKVWVSLERLRLQVDSHKPTTPHQGRERKLVSSAQAETPKGDSLMIRVIKKGINDAMEKTERERQAALLPEIEEIERRQLELDQLRRRAGIERQESTTRPQSEKKAEECVIL